MSEVTIPDVQIDKLDKLAKVYIRIRDKVSELTRAYDAEVEALKAQQEQVAHAMKDKLQALGGKAVKTDYGTVSLVTKTRYFAQDWAMMKKFVMENDALDLLEKRVAQTNMAEFLKGHPGVVPPGLNISSSIEVSVRKPTKG
jgi:hypothetical protein